MSLPLDDEGRQTLAKGGGSQMCKTLDATEGIEYNRGGSASGKTAAWRPPPFCIASSETGDSGPLGYVVCPAAYDETQGRRVPHPLAAATQLRSREAWIGS